MTATFPLQGDCLEILRSLDSDSVDAIVTDPPYELGFMGKGWDASGIAYSVPMWSECLRVLRPGGYLLSFGGTRTYHRMACAVQDAGFEIRDSITWLYGSGFPKGKAQLKPASEPIVVARKPAPGPWLNIDGCRVMSADTLVRPSILRTDNDVLGKGLGAGTQVEPGGRWPSNVVLTHAPDCVDGGACVAGCPVAELDQQSGTLKSGSRQAGEHGLMGADVAPMPAIVGDSGGASRFFPVFRYQAKAPSRERPEVDGVKHPTVKPLALMQWLVRLVTPLEVDGRPGIVLDPFAGSGTTLEAARAEGFDSIGIERDPAYYQLILKRLGFLDEPVEVAS